VKVKRLKFWLRYRLKREMGRWTQTTKQEKRKRKDLKRLTEKTKEHLMYLDTSLINWEKWQTEWVVKRQTRKETTWTSWISWIKRMRLSMIEW
jgi:hypothetical protein